MFRRVADFLPVWEYEAEATAKTLGALTDASLTQRFHPDVRTLGRLAWHLAQTVPEMGARTGLKIEGPAEDEPVPDSAATLAARYRAAADSLASEVRAHWSDAELEVEDDMYGERWARGRTLHAIVLHQAHHRAQMTVLMRLAGLPVSGVYGPAREDWSRMGMAAPE